MTFLRRQVKQQQRRAGSVITGCKQAPYVRANAPVSVKSIRLFQIAA